MADDRVTVSAVLQANRWLLLVVAFLLPLAACAILAGFRDSLSPATDVLILVLLVVAGAATGDRLAGIIAAVSGGVWFDFFLTKPFHQFSIHNNNSVETTVLLVLIGAAVTELALWGRRQQAGASQRAGYLDGVLRTAEIVSARKGSPQAVIDLVADQIVDVLGIVTCRFVPGPVTDPRLAVMDHDGIVTRAGQRLRVDRDGLPTDEQTALLVLRQGETVGHFVLTSASEIARPTREQRRVAVLLADQAASVLGQRAP
jgi:K+-sensing histidine kinase KdpD